MESHPLSQEMIPVRSARTAIIDALLGFSASADLTVGDEKRVLFHAPSQHAPARRLPWPISLLQMHDVQLVVSANGGRIRRDKKFKRSQISEAVDEFLAGASADAQVRLSKESFRLPN